VTVLTGARMNQIVTTNHFRVRIRKKRERVTRLLHQVARDFRCVHADGYRTHAGGFKLFQVFLYAS